MKALAKKKLCEYQDALVRKGLEQMRTGRTVSHEEVIKRMKLKAAKCSNDRDKRLS